MLIIKYLQNEKKISSDQNKNNIKVNAQVNKDENLRILKATFNDQ